MSNLIVMGFNNAKATPTPMVPALPMASAMVSV